jgi:hypothetical protein
VVVHRLLSDGVRPAVLALEVMPALFVAENRKFLVTRFAARDVPIVRPYAHSPFDYDCQFVRYRFKRATEGDTDPNPFGLPLKHDVRGGSRHLEDELTPAEHAKRTEVSRQFFGAALQRMTLAPGADRAFRDTLREAAEHGVRVVLLRMPEGPAFRSWYDPDGLARFDAYLAGVATEFGVPVVDARLWLEEADFCDSHHTLKRGAVKFTTRFAREMSVPRSPGAPPAR